MAFSLRQEKSSVIIGVYIIGLLFQAVYLPYLARLSPNFLTASIDAGYSWVWDRPIYYDTEKNKNISAVELAAWRSKSAEVPQTSNWLLDKLPNPWLNESERMERGLPSAWVQIYGIDYKRLLLSILLWTISMRGVFYVVKKKEN